MFLGRRCGIRHHGSGTMPVRKGDGLSPSALLYTLGYQKGLEALKTAPEVHSTAVVLHDKTGEPIFLLTRHLVNNKCGERSAKKY